MMTIVHEEDIDGLTFEVGGCLSCVCGHYVYEIRRRRPPQSR